MQPIAGNPRMFVWQNGQGAWAPNPRPSEAAVAEHLDSVRQNR